MFVWVLEAPLILQLLAEGSKINQNAIISDIYEWRCFIPFSLSLEAKISE